MGTPWLTPALWMESCLASIWALHVSSGTNLTGAQSRPTIGMNSSSTESDSASCDTPICTRTTAAVVLFESVALAAHI